MWFTMSVVLLCVSLPSLHAQTSDTQASDANKSWTATTESQTSNTNPTRATESHRRSGNLTVDSQNVARLGPDGHYEPYFDTEKESIQVTPTTMRTVVRTFSRDGSGRKILTQMTEEERQSLQGGHPALMRRALLTFGTLPAVSGWYLLTLENQTKYTPSPLIFHQKANLSSVS